MTIFDKIIGDGEGEKHYRYKVITHLNNGECASSFRWVPIKIDDWNDDGPYSVAKSLRDAKNLQAFHYYDGWIRGWFKIVKCEVEGRHGSCVVRTDGGDIEGEMWSRYRILEEVPSESDMDAVRYSHIPEFAWEHNWMLNKKAEKGDACDKMCEKYNVKFMLGKVIWNDDADWEKYYKENYTELII